MNFNEYQQKAWKTALYPNQGHNFWYPALGLGESGEAQNIVKKVYRDNNGVITEEQRQKLIKELGDIMWYVAAMATELNCELDYIASLNLEKLYSRLERGTVKGDGDNR